MKILWCVNILLPDIAKAIGAPHIYLGGWMVSLSSDKSRKNGKSHIDRAQTAGG